MNRRLLNLAVLAVVFAMGSSLLAQETVEGALLAQETAEGATDAHAVLQAAWDALGYANVKTIQYSGSGMIAAVGQSYSYFAQQDDYPRFSASSYTRTIDFDAMSSDTDYTLEQGLYPPHGGGGTPLRGQVTTEEFLGGNYAWNVQGGKVEPKMGGYLYGSPEVDYRKLDIIMTPIGFLKAALAPGANPKLISPKLMASYAHPDGGVANMVSIMVLGKYRVVGTIDEKNRVEYVCSWIGNPFYGDMLLEDRYTDWKDYGGVRYPANLHIHQGDTRVFLHVHNSMNINLSTFKANVSVPAVSVPEAVKTADPSVTHVTSQKLGDGVWLIGGSDFNSVAVEFKDFVTVVEAPENEARSLAVINEVNRLIPGKPIQYVVNTHSHWDHAGGLRTYVTQSATVVTSELNKDFYDQVLFSAAPRTIMPDRYSTYYPYYSGDRYSPMGYVGANDGTIPVRPYSITDGNQILEVYPVYAPLAWDVEEVSPMNSEGVRNLHIFHANNMLVVYLPKQKILINSDLYTPPVKGSPAPPADNNMKLLQTVMLQNHMDVALQVSIEGLQPGSEEQFEQIVGACEHGPAGHFVWCH